MKIAIYYPEIKEGDSEWGNWNQFMIDLAKQNPDINWEQIEDHEEFSHD